MDTETTGLDSLSASIVGISIATDEGDACYIPIKHVKKVFDGADLFNDGQDVLQENQIPLKDIVSEIKPLLSKTLKLLETEGRGNDKIFDKISMVFPSRTTFICFSATIDNL